MDAILAFWRGFDMDAIRVDLDKNSEAVSKSQIESAASRKRLGESTKAFKRVPDDAKLAAFGGLLKVCVCVLRAICFHATAIDCLEYIYGPTLIPSRYVKISLPTTGLSGRGRPAHSPVAVLGGRLHGAVQIAVRFQRNEMSLHTDP